MKGPLTLDGYRSELAALGRAVDRLTAGADRRAFNWQPEAGRRWSVGQCLDHIVKSNALYGGAIEAAVADAPPAARSASRAARPNLIGRWFVALLEPPVRWRTRTAASVLPAPDLDPARVAAAMRESLERLGRLAERAWAVDLERVRFANPFLRGRRVFNVAAGLAVLTAHARRHVWQADRVRAAPGFPRA